MPHIYIPEVFISQDEYDMIQDNQVPIDAFVANKIREDSMLSTYRKQMLDTNVHRTTNGVTSSMQGESQIIYLRILTKGRQFVIFRL